MGRSSQEPPMARGPTARDLEKRSLGSLVGGGTGSTYDEGFVSLMPLIA